MSDHPPRQTAPSKTAAGLTSLKVTYEHAQAQTGLSKAVQLLRHANQSDGFDCPGCAWPDPNERSWFEFCENGAKAMLDEATEHKVGPEFFEQHSISDLRAWSDLELNRAGRITQPLVRRPGSDHYQALSYEQAYQLLAEELARLDSPDQAVFYTSGRTSNEAAFLYQLMVRAFGTNNLPDCSNLCHESSGVALKHTLGFGKGTVRLSDFEQSDLILVIGQNPGTNHPRMLSALRAAKKNGATLISINPLIETGLKRFAHPQHPQDIVEGGVDICDRFVRVQVAGDQALFRALNKRLLELEATHPSAIDRDFIEHFSLGVADLERAAAAQSYQELEALSGIPFDEIDSLARCVLDSRAIICCWAMGLTQHENAVDTIMEVSNFLLLRGNMGRPGAGACPVRGHSNVQGDRSMGIAPELEPVVRKRLETRYGFALPEERGLDSVGTIQALRDGTARVFVSLGGNFLGACPDTTVTEQALWGCALTMHISTKLNRAHLAPGTTSLILPCLGRSERDLTSQGEQCVSVENSMGIVQRSRGALKPPHPELRGEPRIIGELAQVLFNTLDTTRPAWTGARGLDWLRFAHDYSAIRQEIAAVIPGFGDYNQRLGQAGGFELDNGPRERRFENAAGKALFVAPVVRRLAPEDGELVLMTLRSHDQFNTTIYSNNDRYRGISESRRVLLLHPEDLSARGLKSGSRITITSYFEQQTRSVSGFYALPYDVPRGTAVAYFPEANPLIMVESYAKQSRTPTSKSVRIRVMAQPDVA